ncbi:MAG TPA: T9SS type A sorting domain-containing protein [Fluviicola sp.]|nr:T9SS type A sorting domain-containing protein [Fluviicola sp.]
MEYGPNKMPHADSQKPFIGRWLAVYLLLVTGCILCTELANAQTIGAAPLKRMSGAPIGDTSIMIYPFGGMLPSQSMTLKHPLLQDSVRISGVTGSPSYFHLYRVDALPNVTCGLPTAVSNRYFGVFTDPPSVQYDVSYYYGGNPYFTPFLEPLMAMFRRNTNADITCPAWSDAAATLYPLGDSARRMTFTGRKEFILDHYSIAILPIELSSMTAEWLDETLGKAQVKWITESEHNVAYFSVEKSTDADEWKEFYYQPATGNSDAPSHYAVIDQEATSAMTYYRLKMVDTDGATNVFPPQTLARTFASDRAMVFPNPAGEIINIYFYEKVSSRMLIEISDETGKIIRSFSTDPQPAGSCLSINTHELQNGIYFLGLWEMETNDREKCPTILQTKIALLH